MTKPKPKRAKQLGVTDLEYQAILARLGKSPGPHCVLVRHEGSPHSAGGQHLLDATVLRGETQRD